MKISDEIMKFELKCNDEKEALEIKQKFNERFVDYNIELFKCRYLIITIYNNFEIVKEVRNFLLNLKS